jgi:hypothetical protein
MNQEIATTNGAALAGPQKNYSAPAVDGSDILIPRLYLTQALSNLAKQGLAQSGDIIRSTTKKAVAVKGANVEVIPLTFFKDWTIKRRKNANDPRGEYVAREPWTHGDEKLPLEFQKDGALYFRDLHFNLYCLIASDVAKEVAGMKRLAETDELPEADESLLPVLVSFYRTGYKTGQAFATHFAQCADVSERSGKNVPGYGYTFNLGAEFVDGDNSYWKYTAARNRKVTDDERAAAERWMKLLGTAKNIQVDADEEPIVATAAEPAKAGTREF